MGKQSKSRRLSQNITDSAKKHDEQFPYRERFSDAERKQEEVKNSTVGGF